MSSIFAHGLPVSCPDCGRRDTELVHRKVGGGSIDIGICESCGHGFRVYYSLKAVERAQWYDRPSNLEKVESKAQEALAEAQQRLAEAVERADLENTAKKLREEFEQMLNKAIGAANAARFSPIPREADEDNLDLEYARDSRSKWAIENGLTGVREIKAFSRCGLDVHELTVSRLMQWRGCGITTAERIMQWADEFLARHGIERKQ
jgi:hypothetical protein